MSAAHKWSPIEDIPDAAALSDGELPALIEVWKDQGGALAAPGAVSKFSERLNREWAIETGIIERAYTLDRGTTETLIEKGIEASLIPRSSTDRDPEEVAAILQDHLDALDGMFAIIKGDRELSVGYIKELHSALLRHVRTYTVRDPSGNLSERELLKGVYKTQPNSPTRPDGAIHEYCPPEHVASEMDRLIEIHAKHVVENLAAEIQAAWLHHAFTQIHPFADGNGRVARTLASLAFVKSGGFPLVIRREDHARYIDALERADTGDLSDFIALLIGAERRVLIGALQALPPPGHATRKSEPQNPEEAIADIRNLLVSRGEVLPKGWGIVDDYIATLLHLVTTRFNQIVTVSRSELTSVRPNLLISHHATADEAAMGYLKNARIAAQAYGFDLRLEERAQIRSLDFQPGASKLIFATGRIGRVYRGVEGAVLFFANPDAEAVLVDIFQFNYKDKRPRLDDRFKKCFETGLTRALEMWRAQI